MGPRGDLCDLLPSSLLSSQTGLLPVPPSVLHHPCLWGAFFLEGYMHSPSFPSKSYSFQGVPQIPPTTQIHKVPCMCLPHTRAHSLSPSHTVFLSLSFICTIFMPPSQASEDLWEKELLFTFFRSSTALNVMKSQWEFLAWVINKESHLLSSTWVLGFGW